MLTTLLTIIGGSIGGLLRFVPEILKLFTDAKDREHEYRMTQLQLEIDRARASQAIDLVHAQGAAAAQAGEMQAYLEAIKAQAQQSGVPWADALNAAVRPLVTYWWMALFSLYKLATLSAAWQQTTGLTEFASSAWTAQDAGVLSMILGFWFVDRSIRKMSGK